MENAAPEYPQSTTARYRALLEITELIGAHRCFKDFFRELSRLLMRIIPSEGIGITIYDMDRKTTQLFLLEAQKANDIPAGVTFPLDETPASQVLVTRQPFYAPDLEKETRFNSVRNLLLRQGIRSFCVLPLTTARGILGGLHFGAFEPNAYSAEDIEFMRLVARQVAVVFENILSYESIATSQQELAKERDHLRLLLEVSNAVTNKLDTQELFSAISACLRMALEADAISIALFEPQNNCLRRHFVDFPSGIGLLKTNEVVPFENTPIGEAFTKAAPVIACREDIERLPNEIAKSLLSEGLNSFSVVPLIYRKRVLGTLNLACRRENAYKETEIKLLEETASQFAVALDNALAYRHIEELNEKLAEEKQYLANEIRSNYFFEEIIGDSPSLRSILRQVEVVAPSDSTVLICGETGTGKELVARAIHNLSSRQEATFVKLNCAAIPTGLMESEMFGHEKGAFTGAIARRIGRFELAHHGTLFLDEIGEIPLDLQPKLLRVLQEQEFERLGSARTMRVDVRLVAATNKDLHSMVKKGEFRPDLFYRLNVFPIVMPPLRDRREDIPKLVRYFVQQVARRMGKHIKTINPEAMEGFMRYSWPGNVRELQNIIERAVILSPGPVLKVPLEELTVSPEMPGKISQTLEEAERQHILQVLEETNWVVGGPHGAATCLGMKRSTLQSRMQKLRIFRVR
jgi:formate hydrogenlyase transcriptional activator